MGQERVRKRKNPENMRENILQDYRIFLWEIMLFMKTMDLVFTKDLKK